MRIAIVTGASSGIGYEFVHQISKKYKTIEEIWVIARREDRLKELKKSIKNVNIRILPYDLTDDEHISQYTTLLKDENPQVRLLINCSGFGKIGQFTDLSKEDNFGMVQLNCDSLVQMTYLTLPYMTGKGNILQIASSAAFLPQPGFAVYAASKSFVLSFSRALNQELKLRNIYVTAVCPGPVKTEFFDIAETTGEIKIYKTLFMADVKAVVAKALRDASKGKEKSVYGLAMKGFYILSKIIPHRIMIQLIK